MKIFLSVLDTASAVYFVSFLIIKQISYEYFQSIFVVTFTYSREENNYLSQSNRW